MSVNPKSLRWLAPSLLLLFAILILVIIYTSPASPSPPTSGDKQAALATTVANLQGTVAAQNGTIQALQTAQAHASTPISKPTVTRTPRPMVTPTPTP